MRGLTLTKSALWLTEQLGQTAAVPNGSGFALSVIDCLTFRPPGRLNGGAQRLLGHSAPDVRHSSPHSPSTVGSAEAPAILSMQLLARVIERVLQENHLNHPSYTDVNLPCAANALPPMRMPLTPKGGYVPGIRDLNG